jgi:mannose/fructose/sorbose-specific phosphotransferase system IIA component
LEVTVRRFDVLIASHGSLASAMLEAAGMICGDHSDTTAIGLEPDESPEAFGNRLEGAITAHRRTLVLTDLYGGTPHNVACALTRRNHTIRCVAGVNLGLLIEAITCDEELDDSLVERLVTSARDAVVDVSARLAHRVPRAS